MNSYFSKSLTDDQDHQQHLDFILKASPDGPPFFAVSMLNVGCPADRGAKDSGSKREHMPRGGWSGKKTSTTTKILLKEAAKPHHNLGERVVQVRTYTLL
jgi:hypothetical protein